MGISGAFEWVGVFVAIVVYLFFSCNGKQSVMFSRTIKATVFNWKTVVFLCFFRVLMRGIL